MNSKALLLWRVCWWRILTCTKYLLIKGQSALDIESEAGSSLRKTKKIWFLPELWVPF